MRKSLSVVQVFLLVAVLLTPARGLAKPAPSPAAVSRNSASEKDPRLDQKVTYQVKLRPVADMADDLSKLTGIRLVAGRGAWDWRVREDNITVMAKDIPLPSLMASIGRVMKFQWVRRGVGPDWSYRLVEDPLAISRVKERIARQEREATEQRQRDWERFAEVAKMTGSEIEKVKDEDPGLYLMAKSGALAPLLEFVSKTPDLQDAWMSGREVKLFADSIPPDAQEALMRAIRANAVVMNGIYADNEAGRSSVDAEMAKLDQNRDAMVVSMFKGYLNRNAISLQVQAADSYAGLTVRTGRIESRRFIDGLILRSYEQGVPYAKLMADTREQWKKLWQQEQPKIRIYSMTQEPLLEHTADPGLSEPLGQKVDGENITDMLASLADATGLAVVSDDLSGEWKQPFEKGDELRKVLDTISVAKRHNWNRSQSAIEMWDMNWYDNREARVSKAWLESLRRRFRQSGTLDVNDLADMACLTDQQILRNIQDDEVLRYATHVLWDRRDYLKLYGSLTAAQRSALLSGRGLAYANLTPEQQDQTMKLVSGRNVPFLRGLDLAAIGAGVICSKEPLDRRFVYTLRAFTSLGFVPDQYRFSTPGYVEPPKPPEPAADTAGAATP